MYKRMKMVAIVIAICMLISILPVGGQEKYEASEKVTSELLELLNVTYEDLSSGNFEDTGETYSCVIWIEDVEIEQAVVTGIEAAEKTQGELSARILGESSYTAYQVDGLTYVDVILDENSDNEYVQTYIEAERETATELYSENNSSFVRENFMARDMSITYISKYSPCIFAELNMNKIAELIENGRVARIGYSGEEGENNSINSAYYGNVTLSTGAIQQQVEVIRADEARDIYNVTGDGVKIGQYETYCPTVSTVNVHPDLDELVEGDAHADNVYSIMAMTAPDATYYAVGEFTHSGTFYEKIEWLLDQGVNIINFSGGTPGADYVNKYTEQARWVDHIAYNHDVHFVVAAGNENNPYYVLDNEGVRSPGMAYNVITVGNLRTDDDDGDGFVIHYESSYNHNGGAMTTYKPDIVAPGTYTSIYGTSFATPLVTGTIALMCDYRPALKTKQFSVKAILAAAANTNSARHVTTDEDFKLYGAGMVDARSALYAIYAGDFSPTTSLLTTLGSSKTYTMNVTSSDTLMRVALAYGNRIEYSSDGGDHPISSVPSGIIGSLDLDIYDPNGNRVAYVHSADLEREANLKVLEFEPNGVYGNYTIKVTVETRAVYCSNAAISFDIAWR